MIASSIERSASLAYRGRSRVTARRGCRGRRPSPPFRIDAARENRLQMLVDSGLSQPLLDQRVHRKRWKVTFVEDDRIAQLNRTLVIGRASSRSKSARVRARIWRKRSSRTERSNEAGEEVCMAIIAGLTIHTSQPAPNQELTLTCPQPARYAGPSVRSTSSAHHIERRTVRARPAASVVELLTRLEIDPRRVAIEHNLSIIKRHTFPDSCRRRGSVEIVNFVGGG